MNGKGLIIQENLLGVMEEYIQGNIWMIKNMEMVNLLGQMEVNILENGKMGSNMDQEYIMEFINLQKKDNGPMENELNGLINKTLIRQKIKLKVKKNHKIIKFKIYLILFNFI